MMRRIRNFGRKGEMAFSTFLGFMGGKPFLNKNAQKHENDLFAFFVLILTWFYLIIEILCTAGVKLCSNKIYTYFFQVFFSYNFFTFSERALFFIGSVG